MTQCVLAEEVGVGAPHCCSSGTGFDNLTIGAEERSTLRLYIWTLVDSVFAVVIGTTACRLWRKE